MNVYVIEDNNQQRKQIIHYINDCKRDFISLNVSDISNHLTFMKEIPKLKILDNDVFFLDIDLKTTYNGIDLAIEIRKSNKSCSIIFLTSMEGEAINVINNEIFPLGYIIKELKDLSKTKQIIYSLLKKSQLIPKEEGTSKQNKLKISNRSETLFLDIHDICYVQTLKGFGGKVLIKMLSEEMIVEGKIGKIKKQLQQDYMMTSLQSYILNLENVVSISRKKEQILFSSGIVLSVSTKIIDKVKKAAKDYVDD